jgi:peptidoglycan/xylan/chitin deacetylase (PgdA/CDA1 family)
LVCLMPPCALAQSDLEGTTIAPLNVRSGPGVGYGAFAYLPVHTPVAIEAHDDSGEWLLVHSANAAVRGWVATAYVQLDPGIQWGAIPFSVEELVGQAEIAPAESQAPAESVVPAAPASGSVSGRISASLLIVRGGPGRDAPQVASLGRGTEVTIAGRNAYGDWVFVQTIDGAISGWAAVAYIELGVHVLALPEVEGAAASGPASVDGVDVAAFVLDGNEPALQNNLILTIDDCSVEANVRWAYEILKNRGVTATFFPNTININDQDPQLWRDIVAAGNEIGYHTRSHMSGLTAAELDYDFQVFTEEVRAILSDPGYTIRYIRPPRGVWDSKWLLWGAERQLYTVKWNLSSQTYVAHISQTARDRVHGGSIILMHTGRADLEWLQSVIDNLMQLTTDSGGPLLIRTLSAALAD